MEDTEAENFSETQAFAAWVYVLLGLSTSVSLGSLVLTPRVPVWFWLWPGATLALAFNLLCLRTRVTATAVTVTFGALFPFYRRRIALCEIASAEAVTYSPLAEYGGWGIRGWGHNVALNARGDRGVRLTLCDGRRLLIGSQKPEALAAALTAPR